MHRSWLSLAIGVTAAVVLAVLIASWGFSHRQRNIALDSLRASPAPPAIDEATRTRIAAFCGDCHALPRPESFPREQWHHEVGLGYEFYARSGRRDLDPPPMQDVVNYYRALAPEQLVFPQPKLAAHQLRTSFRTENLDWHGSHYFVPAVSFLRWMEGPGSDKMELFACDMRDGSVSAIDIQARPVRRRVLTRLQNPCHIEPGDIDGDGNVDWIVAELGSMLPDDHDRGKVVLLRHDPQTGSFSETVVASDRGRIADARPADMDGDGDLDLLVAEFGHYQTGSILLLDNVSEPGGDPRFETIVIDRRPGTIHLPIHDFNGDGRLDFAALVSQEYERVDLFMNQGGAKFHLHPVWAGPDLTFGSSGLELADVDADGDMDLLVTNGDSFDTSFASPWHGVQWLENLGEMQFAYHRLVDLPGAYRALPVDIDLDEDVDLLVVAWLPVLVQPQILRGRSTASVVCLEQTDPGQYALHVLESAVPHHASLEVGDFDGDGDFDFVVGSMIISPQRMSENDEIPSRLTIWWNQLRP